MRFALYHFCKYSSKIKILFRVEIIYKTVKKVFQYFCFPDRPVKGGDILDFQKAGNLDLENLDLEKGRYEPPYQLWYRKATLGCNGLTEVLTNKSCRQIYFYICLVSFFPKFPTRLFTTVLSSYVVRRDAYEITVSSNFIGSLRGKLASKITENRGFMYSCIKRQEVQETIHQYYYG